MLRVYINSHKHGSTQHMAKTLRIAEQSSIQHCHWCLYHAKAALIIVTHATRQTVQCTTLPMAMTSVMAMASLLAMTAEGTMNGTIPGKNMVGH
jgi:hypothetical protein